jgi:hypothetical protein
MSRIALAAAAETLEKGAIAFHYRPHDGGLDEIQRIVVVLAPQESAFQRAIVIGRKRLTRAAPRDRFWGFVDLVLTPSDMHAALSALVYSTPTRALCQIPAARKFAAGAYELATAAGQLHLRWEIDRVAGEPAPHESAVERSADYVVSIANPDPSAWGFVEPPDLQSELFDELETHVTLPAPFPPSLQQRFEGRRLVTPDSTAWLDHPGAELVFVDGNRRSPGEPRLRLLR